MIAGLWQSVRNRLFPRSGNLILMYHRVADTDVDPWELCVSPRHFAEQMETLARLTEPVPLADIRKPSKRRARVAVTFDDGYVDNLFAARPILERFSAPATVFVSTGFIGSPTGFWWDRLEAIFLHPGSLPSRPLTLNVERTVRTWSIAEPDQHYTDSHCRQYRGWVAWKAAPPTTRHAVFYDVWKSLMSLPDVAREEQLSAVADWAGRPATAKARCMNHTELRELFKGNLVTPGAHTVSHRRLAALAPERQREEIEGSRRQLEFALSRRITDFSYPFGGKNDYTRDTVRAVADSGYERACTNFGGLVQPASSSLELPRVHAPDLSGKAFRDWLSTVIDV